MEISHEKRGSPPKIGEKADKVMGVCRSTIKDLEEYGIKPNREIAIKKLLKIVELIKFYSKIVNIYTNIIGGTIIGKSEYKNIPNLIVQQDTG